MRIKTALIIFFAFSFIGTSAILSRLAIADDQSSVETRHHWILWKIEQDPRHPVAYAMDVFRSKKSCTFHIPRHPASIYGPGPKKHGYHCLLMGVEPIDAPSPRPGSHSAVPSGPSSPANNGSDERRK